MFLSVLVCIYTHTSTYIYILLYALEYLSMRAFLQGGLYHNVALHAHLELRDWGWYTAVTRRPQRSQELSSSDRVHYHSPVLTHSEQPVRVSKDAVTLFSDFLHLSVYVLFFLLSQCKPELVNQR